MNRRHHVTRVYHYNSIFKYFIRAEDKERPDGVGLPAHSTDIPPPVDKCKENEICVFENGEWSIKENNFWEPSIQELNYDAGRAQDTFQFIKINYNHFPRYKPLPQLCNNPAFISMYLMRLHDQINEEFKKLISIYGCINKSTSSETEAALIFHSALLSEYPFQVEKIIYFMRRMMDLLVQISFVLIKSDGTTIIKKIQFDSIGSVSRLKDKTNKSELEEKLCRIFFGGNEYEHDKTNFLEVLNDLFNSYKHHFAHIHSASLFGADVPTVIGYECKMNNYNNPIVYHNHNAYHIMMGFQDSLTRILRNQNKMLQEQETGG